MSLKDKEKWDGKYLSPSHSASLEPCDWLVQNSDLLTGRGKALDVAMGEGRNSLFAAQLGYDVHGMDISEVGIKKARKLAAEKGVKISAEATDLDNYNFKKNQYDLVMCFYFLDRNLFSGFRDALRPGGLLFLETFNSDHLKYTDFKKEWVLEPNELLKAFSDLHILRYREKDEEEKAFSSIVARKE